MSLGLDRLPESDMHGRYIFEATRAGLWPFKPRTINVWVEYDINFHRLAIFVQTWFLDGQVIWREFIDAGDLDADPHKTMYDVSWKFFHAFRKREAHEITPNIVLGEN